MIGSEELDDRSLEDGVVGNRPQRRPRLLKADPGSWTSEAITVCVIPNMPTPLFQQGKYKQI